MKLRVRTNFISVLHSSLLFLFEFPPEEVGHVSYFAMKSHVIVDEYRDPRGSHLAIIMSASFSAL